MSDLSGNLGNVGGDINKSGGDAYGVSAAGAYAGGGAGTCGGDGSYYGGGSSSSTGDMMGAGALAGAGGAMAAGGDGGTDNTSIGDITINT